MITIKGFAIDVATSETHSFDADVSMYPVEQGGDITDHVRSKPITLSMECIVSNTGLGAVAGTRTEGGVPSEDAYAWLMQIRDDREPVTINTSRRAYDNMVLQSLSEPVTASTGDAYVFTASFVQIKVVTNDVVTKTIPRAKGKTNRGHKPTSGVTLLTDIIDHGGVSQAANNEAGSVWPGINSDWVPCSDSQSQAVRTAQSDANVGIAPPGQGFAGARQVPRSTQALPNGLRRGSL